MYQQEANKMEYEAQEARLAAAADFQNTAAISDAEMAQAMTIAEGQINTELEGIKSNLINSLVGQGVERYKAELQANTEVQLQYNQLMKDYFAIRQGAIIELGSQIIGEAWFWETPTSVIEDQMGLFERMIGTPTSGTTAGPYSPGGYNMMRSGDAWGFGPGQGSGNPAHGTNADPNTVDPDLANEASMGSAGPSGYGYPPVSGSPGGGGGYPGY
jgi:hypothetical protein